MPKKRKTHTLEIVDSVWVKCSPVTAEIVGTVLTYTDSYWIQGPWKKEQVEYEVSLVEKIKGEYFFYTGLLKRAIQAIKKRKETVKIIDHRNEVFYDDPVVDNAEFRNYQKEALNVLLEQGSGVIKHATGTGKSYIILGIIAAFNQEHILFLVHTKDLMWQLSNLLEKNNIKHSVFHSSAKKDLKGIGQVTVTTVQSYRKVCKEYYDEWDVIIVDEGHHINSIYSSGKKKKYTQYGDVLLHTDAPIRYALTATLPTSKKQLMCMEALVGPVLHTYEMKEASADGVLASCEVEMIPTNRLEQWVVENDYDIRQVLGDVHTEKGKKGKPKKYTKYQIVYFNCITQNTERTVRIVKKIQEHTEKGETVLVCASQTPHIENLARMCRHFNIEPQIVDGDTPQDKRNDIKERFDMGAFPVVIASKVWDEGVSIDTIDVVINAGGGLDSKRVQQIVGRGLRKGIGKTKVKVYDVEDVSHKYLREHTKERKKIYRSLGWLKE